MAADSPGWASVLNTTIPLYIRQETVNILRNRALLALMESKGRISYSNTGTKFDWKVAYRRAPMIGYADSDVISFARIDRHKTAQLPNDRGYVLSEMMSEIDTLQNSGNEAIIKLWDGKAKSMMDDIREQFCDQLYIDGNATGNEKKIHGIESCLGTANVIAAPGFVKPSDTYADLLTDPANYGGNWNNGTWPAGSGDPQYDFWSPILVDYLSPVANAWSGISSINWSNTCNQALRKLITKCKKSKSKDGMLDMIMLEDTLYEQYKNAQDSRQQIFVTRNEKVGLVALGFEAMNFDGTDITSEFGMPDGVGYAFNTMQMELMSMYPELFHSVGPFFDEVTRTYRWLLSFVGNMRLNPKFLGKLKGYAAS
jgi:hypothetical protein